MSDSTHISEKHIRHLTVVSKYLPPSPVIHCANIGVCNGLLLVCAYQTLCGCYLCHICAKRFPSEGPGPPCPGNTDDCKNMLPNGLLKTNIHADRAKSTEVGRLLIPCPYNHGRYQPLREPHCPTDFTIDRMWREHMDNCPHRWTLCDQCKLVEVRLSSLNDHQLNECPQRTVTCDLCHKQMKAEELTTEDHLSLSNVECCPEYRGECPHCHESEFSRHEVVEHWESMCPATRRPCPFVRIGCCINPQFLGTDEQMSQHLSGKSFLDHIYLYEQFHSQQIVHYKNLSQQVSSLQHKVNDELTPLRHQIEVLQLNYSQIMDTLATSLASTSIRSPSTSVPPVPASSTATTVSATDPMEVTSMSTSMPAGNMPLVRTICVAPCEGIIMLCNVLNFRCSAEGLSYLESDPVYMGSETGVPSYNIKFRVYPGGNGTGLNTHLSLYFLLVPGQWDDLLPWPFVHRLQWILIKKWPLTAAVNSQPETVSVTLKPAPESAVAQRPRVGQVQYEAAGHPQFVSLHTLRDFVLNGTAYIYVKLLPVS